MKKIQTWCPLFSGFYNTIWQTDSEEMQELEYINEQREAKGMEPVKWDDVEWDWAGYNFEVCKRFTYVMSVELKAFVRGMTFEKINSPKEYNFRNDSIDVIVTLTKKNEKAILAYLQEHGEHFAKYLRDTYTSYSGFISHYPNTIDGFMAIETKTKYKYTKKAFDYNVGPLEHSHKLGAILDFIARNEEIEELRIYENISGNGCTIQASNYEGLVSLPIGEGV